MTGPATHDVLRPFGHRETTIGEAPGRVNLIGEHTDYSGGFVLPTVIPQATRVLLAANADAQVRVSSHAMPAAHQRGTFRIGEEVRRHEWIDYVQGVTWVLSVSGVPVSGFDAVITSDVPLGSGLSSSASLIVATIRGLRSLFGLPLDDMTLAALARRVETDFLGIPVGPMDPLACTLGRPDCAVLIDTRALTSEIIPLPADIGLAVVNSGIRHSHVTGGYRQRQQECADAAARLGVAMLRDVTDAHDAALNALPAPLDRRARHVVSENARVLAAIDTIRRHDLAALGHLIDASHASLRDDFEVSTPEIDAMVRYAQGRPDVLGARITGGGFGGAIVILTRAGAARTVADEVTRHAQGVLGLDAAALVPA